MNRNRYLQPQFVVASMLLSLLVALPAMAADPAPAAPLADKLPGPSLLYLGWGGVGPNKAALDKTGLGQLLNDPEVKPYVEQMWAQLETFIKAQGEKKLPPGTFDAIHSLVVDVVVDRPWAISLVNVKIDPAAGKPEVSAVLLADLGEKADAASANIDKLLTTFLPPDVQKAIVEVDVKGAKLRSLKMGDDAPDLVWGVTKNHLIVAIGQATAGAVVELINGKGGPTLAADPQFAKVAAKTGGGLFCFYADAAKFRKELLPVILGMAVHDADKIAEINKVVSSLGLTSIDALGYSVRTDGKDFVGSCYLLTPNGKPGLLVLADQKPISGDLLAAVPADATFAWVFNINRVQVLDELEKQLAEFPKAKAKFDEFRKSIEDAVGGVNLRTDLAEAMGQGVAIYNSPSAGGFLFTGLTIVAEVKDAAKLRLTLPKIEATLLNMANKSAPADEAPVAFKSAKFKDYDYRYVVTKGVPMPVAPAWCLTDKYFVVSLFPQSLKAALLKIEAGKDGSLLAGDSLGAQLAGPAKGASAVFYLNQRQLLRIIYPVALPVWQVGCSMAAKAGISMDVNALPRQELLLKYVTDAFSAVIPDPEGVLMTSRDATPLLAPMAVGMGAAVLMPALANAQSQANRIRSRANLSGMGKMLQIYVNQHNNSYPDSLQDLVKDGLSPKALIIPSNSGGDRTYLYIKPGQAPVDNSTSWVVAFEPLEVNNGEGANVLFFDGHVDFIPAGRLNELLKAQGFKTPALAAPSVKKEPEVPAGTNPI